MELTNAIWRKSSKSGANGGECVELAGFPDAIAIRDSKNPHNSKLILSRREFRLFANKVKSH